MAAPILSYEDLGLIQGEGWLFRGLDLYIGERDRLALIGRNGAGKTTLLKCLAGLIDPDEGKRTIVPGTHVVLLEQDPDMQGFETLEAWVLNGGDAPEAHEAAAIADQLGIDLTRPTATASGGERRRAAITRALAQRPDLLLLDEPTNHLDLDSKDVLLEALEDYGGTLVIVSHDRYFVEKLATKIIEIGHGEAVAYPGTYAEFLWHKEHPAQAATPKAQLPTAKAQLPTPKGHVSNPKVQSPKPSGAQSIKPSDGRDARKRDEAERKKRQRASDNLQRRIAELESRIADREKQIRDLEATMAAPEFYGDRDAAKAAADRHQALMWEVGDLMGQWEALQEHSGEHAPES